MIQDKPLSGQRRTLLPPKPGLRQVPPPSREKVMVIACGKQRLVVRGLLPRLIYHLAGIDTVVADINNAFEAILRVSWPGPWGPFKSSVESEYDRPCPLIEGLAPLVIEWEGLRLVPRGIVLGIVSQILSRERLVRTMEGMASGNLRVAWACPSGPYQITVQKYHNETRSSGIAGQMD